MKPLQFYKYATWGLLLLNVLIVGFFFLGPPPNGAHRGGSGPRATELLNLDEQQNQLFLASAKSHETKMNDITKEQKALLTAYFNHLVSNAPTTNKNDLLTQYEQLESQKIKQTYQHFSEIKNILNTEQEADFEVFINDILRFLLPDKRKNPPPPKEF